MNLDDLIGEINAGRHDDQLGKLFDALFSRAAELETDFSWELTLGDDQWTRETVTLTELAFAEKHAGVPYFKLNPIESVDHLVALIVAHLYRANGLKLDAAVVEAGKYTAADLKDIVSVHEVEKAPKDDMAEPPTS